jgi:hypothetical protein
VGDNLDWGALPKPEDDGGSDHFVSMALPDIAVTSTTGWDICLSMLGGLGVLYAYPLTAPRQGWLCLMAGTWSRVPVVVHRKAVRLAISFKS